MERAKRCGVEWRESPGTMAPAGLALASLLVTMWMFASASVEPEQQQEKDGELTSPFVSGRSNKTILNSFIRIRK